MSFINKHQAKKNGQEFVATILKQKALVCEVRFPEGERTAWFIVDIDSLKYKEFQSAMQKAAPINLAAYGSILYSGYGEPSDTIKEEMNQKYGLYE